MLMNPWIKRVNGWLQRAVFYFGSVTLRTKLILSYIVILLVPVILLSAYVFRDLYESAIDDMLRKNEYMLEVELNNVRHNVELMQRTAQLAISNKKVTEYVMSSEELDAAQLIAFREQENSELIRMHFNNPNIAYIRIFTSNPYVKELWPIFLSESRIAGKPWYEEVLKTGGIEQWVLHPEDNDLLQPIMKNADSISLLREISYAQGQHVGLIEVNMPLAHFFPKSFGGAEDGQTQTFLVDKGRRVFTRAESGFLSRSGRELVLDQLQALPHASHGHWEFTLDGVPYLAIYTEVEAVGAYMVNVVSLQTMHEDIEQTRTRMLLVVVLLVGLLSVITYVLNSLILKKLHRLQDSMKQVRRGQFNVEIDIHSGDEVGELAHHFRLMMRRMNELIADAVNKQAATKEAELRSLKNQIDSHFLYNTLENLKMLAEIEAQYTISDALTSLGGMMRYSMNWSGSYVRLQDELLHIRNYIAIMNIRYDNRLVLELDIPPELIDHEVPKMSLQPIVENAVKHGMKEMREDDRMVISVRAYVHSGHTVIEVMDRGCGMSHEAVVLLNESLELNEVHTRSGAAAEQRAERDGSGIGLRNVHQRMRLYYGQTCGLKVESEQGRYTRVELRLSYR
ncbi:sensor histidine kinase [Paenibacillus sp. YYML68]|uniref:cache domain-containing sensor histidine kinase n=1 Tax=Paenibacillus sp. YYML68 TaxID=2909250 RepID=UPI002490E544|nr:histidine kinase [Paenibacillus sp. YYML68]